MARLPIEIDLAQVKQLAAQGMSEIQIAQALGVSPSTIDRRKREDNDGFGCALREGRAAGIRAVTNALFQAATDPDRPNVAAATFYLRNRDRGNWSDRQEHDVSGHISHDHAHDVQRALQTLIDAGVDPESL
jgi:hypothetical protein|tara:strand:- start:3143 stop:3538 length:396 start_codon:yes stop_codon:yes gene_type:complete